LASPGRIVTSRLSPLRLLSRPITATRCAIGVTLDAAATVPFASTVSMSLRVDSGRICSIR